MRKLCFKIVAFVLFILTFSAFSACGNSNTLDLYLIGGQSNACGYTPYENKLTEHFENVWYAGMTDKQLVSDVQNSGSNNLFD